ncbi:hypothetical protein BC832DRAFT_42170 [Gaertneriomyces semiglobifer]|nr:hypothetical protein BC832DRAFT_42170 [Gaertneriomyces semiglobifer]
MLVDEPSKPAASNASPYEFPTYFQLAYNPIGIDGVKNGFYAVDLNGIPCYIVATNKRLTKTRIKLDRIVGSYDFGRDTMYLRMPPPAECRSAVCEMKWRGRMLKKRRRVLDVVGTGESVEIRVDKKPIAGHESGSFTLPFCSSRFYYTIDNKSETFLRVTSDVPTAPPIVETRKVLFHALNKDGLWGQFFVLRPDIVANLKSWSRLSSGDAFLSGS